jgi:hypothetical protein
VYYKKFRVYFQEYDAARHKQITRADWGVGAGGGAATPALADGGDEYDVPQCAQNKGKVTQTCTHTVTGTWRPIDADGRCPPVTFVPLCPVAPRSCAYCSVHAGSLPLTGRERRRAAQRLPRPRRRPQGQQGLPGGDAPPLPRADLRAPRHLQQRHR